MVTAGYAISFVAFGRAGNVAINTAASVAVESHVDVLIELRSLLQ